MPKARRPTTDPNLNFLAGGGEMGERARALDWSQTDVGDPSTWPQSLKTAVSICLGSRYPIVLWWGRPEYTQFYNDAYVPVLGPTKHPGWLGRSARECWSELWPVIGPMFEGVFDTGEATWSEDLLLVMRRNRPQEETYFTFSYSPIRDDAGAVGGIFCACYETTARVVGERRLRTLRDLSRLAAEAKSAEATCGVAAKTLGENGADIPFALIYLTDSDGRTARLAAAVRLEPGSAAAPQTIDLSGGPAVWPLAGRPDTGTEFVFALPPALSGLPGGPWPESPDSALIVPIAAPGQAGPTGFLVAGLSPRRVVDADYRSFLELGAGHIGTAVANARAYAEERRRSEALAEVDRAKTQFFSNVSHEFRTPLTLMIGPLEDALAAPEGALPGIERQRVEVAHRNSLRLLKLVNTLLDFSRIEANRIQASYEPVDLGAVTADIASVFRSTLERASLRLKIDCPALPELAYVDREMWEKVVLNLLSNAFKFTFAGEIEVTVRQTGANAAMTVRDTGTGIPAKELPRLFERFHRVAGAKGRSYEGSGIGLALVQELVRLHGGQVAVTSEMGRGSAFTVTIPLGKAHLPADRIAALRSGASTAARADAYLADMALWSADAAHEAATPPVPTAAAAMPRGRMAAARIVLADDNGDMRDYVRRLLTEAGHQVEVAPDGEAALRLAQTVKPDVVLTDVMMPGMDGFGLLRAMRADTGMADVPVILLSARAGEEARVEGMQAGADDYLTKPFSARELVARVEAHVAMARLRRDANEATRRRTAQFETLLNQAPLGVYLVDSTFRIREVNPVAAPVFGNIPGGVVGRDFDEIIHVLWEPAYADEVVRIFRHTLATGEPYIAAERNEDRRDRGVTESYEWRVDRIPLPDGTWGVVCYFRDVSARVQADRSRRLLTDELRHRVKNTLGTVQGIAFQSFRSATRDEKNTFAERLRALADAHESLSEHAETEVELRVLVERALAPFRGTGKSRLAVDGPGVVLGKDTYLATSLALHELATNAIKHGALSNDSGSVHVSWSRTGAEGHGIHLQWTERGGPPVAKPVHRGFGTVLLTHAFGKSLTMDFRPDGLVCSMSLS